MNHDRSAGSVSSSAGLVSRIRPVLEVVALGMIVAVCGVMIIAVARGNWVLTQVPTQRATAGTATPRREPPLPKEPVSLEGAKLEGPRTAQVAVIEFSDFQCPYCGRFARDSWPSIRKAYVESGKVLFAFREFPLEAIHASALTAAEAAECAGQQDAFWKMHDLIFADQLHLDPGALESRAQKGGLDVTKFKGCLNTLGDSTVKADEKIGVSLAVAGTPTFFLGRIQSDGRVKVLRRLSGALPATDFGAALDAVLATPTTR